MNRLIRESSVKYSCFCWFSEKRHEVSREEKEKEDISRLDGDDDIKVRKRWPCRLLAAGNCHSQMR